LLPTGRVGHTAGGWTRRKKTLIGPAFRHSGAVRHTRAAETKFHQLAHVAREADLAGVAQIAHSRARLFTTTIERVVARSAITGAARLALAAAAARIDEARLRASTFGPNASQQAAAAGSATHLPRVTFGAGATVARIVLERAAATYDEQRRGERHEQPSPEPHPTVQLHSLPKLMVGFRARQRRSVASPRAGLSYYGCAAAPTFVPRVVVTLIRFRSRGWRTRPASSASRRRCSRPCEQSEPAQRGRQRLYSSKPQSGQRRCAHSHVIRSTRGRDRFAAARGAVRDPSFVVLRTRGWVQPVTGPSAVRYFLGRFAGLTVTPSFSAYARMARRAVSERVRSSCAASASSNASSSGLRRRPTTAFCTIRR